MALPFTASTVLAAPDHRGRALSMLEGCTEALLYAMVVFSTRAA